MSDRPSTREPVALPDILAIFPLTGVLLLPRGRLPLNVFEPRYLAMTRDALGGERLIGMIQPNEPQRDNIGEGTLNPPLYPIGCAGRLTQFSETDDGRFLITLTGVSRFRIREELPLLSGYRRVVPDWQPFARGPPGAGRARLRPRAPDPRPQRLFRAAPDLGRFRGDREGAGRVSGHLAGDGLSVRAEREAGIARSRRSR